MSERIWIIVVVTFGVVLTLYIFRHKLSRFKFGANSDGVNAELETHQSTGSADGKKASVRVQGNTQVGRRNIIDVKRDDVEIKKNRQLGEEQKITAE